MRYVEWFMAFMMGTLVTCIAVGQRWPETNAVPLAEPRGAQVLNHTAATDSPDFGNEGTLVLVHELGINPEMVEHGDPAMLSWTYTDREEAVQQVLANNSRGDEPLCLSDLGSQAPQFHMQRWWVFSC